MDAVAIKPSNVTPAEVIMSPESVDYQAKRHNGRENNHPYKPKRHNGVVKVPAVGFPGIKAPEGDDWIWE